MIFSEQDLRIGANAFDIINESAWIDGGSIISPRTIALVESSSVGGYVVRFNDVEALSEEYGIDYIDSMLAIAEVNGIDPQYLAVAVNESDIIINPDLIYELANVITVPISESSTAYQFCEACIDGYAYTGNEGYIKILIEAAGAAEDYVDEDDDRSRILALKPELLVKDPTKRQQFAHSLKLYKSGHLSDEGLDQLKSIAKEYDIPLSNFSPKTPKSSAAAAAYASTTPAGGGSQPPANNTAAQEAPKKTADSGATETAKKVNEKKEQKGEKSEGVIDKIKRTVGSAVHKSADWIARKIASLRLLYRKWMEKARIAKAQGKASWFQTIGEKVLNAIDWALSKLQGFLKSSDESRKKYKMDAWDRKLSRAGEHQSYDQWKTAHAKNPRLFGNKK